MARKAKTTTTESTAAPFEFIVHQTDVEPGQPFRVQTAPFKGALLTLVHGSPYHLRYELDMDNGEVVVHASAKVKASGVLVMR